MSGSMVNFGSLPRASTLTDVLLAPTPERVSREQVSTVRSILERDVASVTRRVEHGEPLRVDPYRIRRTVIGTSDEERPFQWNPWTARRQIGLEAVRASLGRPRLTPLEATRDAIDRLLRRTADDTGRESLVTWLAGLPTGALAVVQAEAVLWATQLISALDWARPATRLVGFDRSVVACESPRVILRGRVDVELRPLCPQGGDTGGSVSGLLVLMTGHPLPSARLELTVSALVSALSDRPGAVPARVVGLWPQCGRALALPVDMELLLRGSAAVVDALRVQVEDAPRRLPAPQHPGLTNRAAQRAAS